MKRDADKVALRPLRPRLDVTPHALPVGADRFPARPASRDSSSVLRAEPAR